MSEEKKIVKVKLVRHEWPDERRKRHKKYLKRALIGVLAIFLFVGGIFVGIVSSSSQPEILDSKLHAVYRIMNELWYFGKDIEDFDQKLLDDAIYGMTSQEEDKHTSYLSAADAKSFMGSMEGRFVGIGIQYSTATDDYIVLKVFEGSPAAKAGIKVGDILRQVEGKDVTEIEDITTAIKGEEGTKVHLTFQRGNDLFEVDCERGSVESSVNGYIQNNVGILEISTIGETTAQTVGNVLAMFEEQGIDDIIVDLRGNGGGYITSILDITSYFLPKDSVVLKEKDRNGNISEDKVNPDITPYTYDQIEILIDYQTASAAEVFTIALMETLDNVTVIGDISYGKGSVQTTQPFSDGSMLKYTKALWLSPKGTSINGVGIKPDILVPTDETLRIGIPVEVEEVGVDTVSVSCMSMQYMLEYLGYSIDRKDGYFSHQTLVSMKQFEKDYGLKNQEKMDQDLLTIMFSKVIYESHVNESRDLQKLKAFEELKK